MKSARVNAVHDSSGRTIDQHLGAAIRDLRQRYKLTIADVARRTHISRGMLSKIENGQTSTSLEILAGIAYALGTTLSNLFRGFDAPAGGAQIVKKGAGMEVVRRGTKRGHTYHLLAYDHAQKKIFEPFLVTMNDDSEVYPTFEHPGTEFLYVLEGKVRYRHGRHTYLLARGDALTFEGSVPHGPVQLLKTPIRMLSIIIYDDDTQDHAKRY